MLKVENRYSDYLQIQCIFIAAILELYLSNVN